MVRITNVTIFYASADIAHSKAQMAAFPIGGDPDDYDFLRAKPIRMCGQRALSNSTCSFVT
jgi:hypothetical protein